MANVSLPPVRIRLCRYGLLRGLWSPGSRRIALPDIYTVGVWQATLLVIWMALRSARSLLAPLIHTPEAGVDQQSQCCEQVACTQDEQAGDEMYPFDEIATPNEWVYAAAFLLYCTGFLPQAVRRNHSAWKSSCNISMSMSRYNWSSSSRVPARIWSRKGCAN